MATPLMSLQAQTPGNLKYLVPWKSRQEFIKIYHDVYSGDEDLQLKAIKRITAWKSRVGSKLSVAVENTGAILESITNHKIALREHQVHTKESLLRSGYSLAIIRFVNLVIEKGQTKQSAVPVHSLAKEFGIPEWIVRLRHDATHNTLPGLDILATGAAWAFQYLKEEFWDCQTQHSVVGKRYARLKGSTKLIGKIRQTLHNFQNLRVKEIGPKDDSENVPVTTTSDVKVLKHHMKVDRYCFMKCLLEDGSLISTAKQLEGFGLSKEDVMSQLSPCLPAELRELWHPVITMLRSTKSVSTLAKVAVLSMSDEDCLRNHLLTAWLIFFLTFDTGTRAQNKRRRSNKKGFSSGEASIALPRKLMLSVCLENVNKFTIHLLRHLMDRNELGEEAYLKLADLLSVSSSPMIDETALDDSERKEESAEDSVYTVEDLKEASFSNDNESLFQPVLENVQASVSGEDIGWTICTDLIDWSKVPLGVNPLSSELAGDMEEDEEGEETDGGENTRDSDNVEESYDDDHGDNSDNDRRVRGWKRLQRKRSVEDVERTSPKRSSYVVNDTELL